MLKERMKQILENLMVKTIFIHKKKGLLNFTEEDEKEAINSTLIQILKIKKG